MKKIVETKLQIAKRISLGYWNRDFSDVFVTFPDQAVYVNTDPSKLEDHVIANKLEVVIVKQNGVVFEDQGEMPTPKASEAVIAEKKKGKNKL